MKCKIALCVTIVVSSMVNSPNILADWNGYVNKKTLSDRPYGYLTAASILSNYRKVKLVCFPPNEYYLYLDETITEKEMPSKIGLTVDQLPPPNVTAVRTDKSVLITNQAPEFWVLIAQMSAGAKLTVTTGNGEQHGYSLIGFTKTYLDNCGWMKTSNKYQGYLARYR